MTLPTPERKRWTFLRAGFVDVWEFDQQQFEFYRGRLVLRGRNESGKSKTLEMLLPFLLDASLRPERLGAERNRSRVMYWNLLNDTNTDRNNRTGYVWIELGRLVGTTVETVTLGAGLNARRDAGSDVDAWFFATPCRVGRDLTLVDENGEALSQRRLRDDLGELGRVFDRPAEYRRHVNETLFEMEPDQYDSLIETLLQLRQPKLSKTLDVQKVSELLEKSLPPLDRDIVRRLASDFDEIEDHRVEVENRRQATKNVRDTLRVARRYASAVCRDRATTLTTADSQYHKSNATLREQRETLEEARVAMAGNTVSRAQNSTALGNTRTELETYLTSEGYQGVVQLAETDKDRNQAARDLLDSEAEASRRATESATARVAGAAQHRQVEDALAAEQEEWKTLASEAREADVDPGPWGVERAKAEQWTHQEARGVGHRWLAEARAIHGELTRLHGAAETARTRFEGAESEEARALAQLEAARADRTARSEKYAQLEQAFFEAVQSWRLGAAWAARWEFDDEAEPDRAVAGAKEAARVEAVRIGDARELLAREEAPLLDRRSAIRRETADLLASTHAAPPTPSWRAPRDRLGAPFYLLCDVRNGADPVVAARLEGALSASGLLDAWITPGGQVIDLDHDVVALPTEPVTGPTLRDWLVPVDHPAVASAIVDRVLRSVAVVSDLSGGTDGFDLAGGWRQGVLRGNNVHNEVRYIGATARERERQRRLTTLAADENIVERELASVGQRRTALLAELDAVNVHLGKFPDVKAMTRAAGELEEANRGVTARQVDFDAAARLVATRRSERDRAVDALAEAARRLGRANWLGRLDDLGSALDRLAEALRAWTDAAREMGNRRKRLADLLGASQAAELREKEAVDAVGERGRRLSALDAKLRALRDSLGSSPEEILERARRLRGDVARLEKRRTELDDERAGVEGRLGTVTAAVEQHEERVASWDRARTTAHEAMAAVARHGLVRIVLEVPEDPPTGTLTDAIEVARQLTREHGASEDAKREIEAAENRLIERYQQLQRELPPDYALEIARVDDVARIEARAGAETFALDRLEVRLADQVLRQEKLLGEAEARVFAEFLTGETRRHLRDRLVRAEELIRGANEVLQRCPTPQGTRIKLKWVLADDAPQNAQRAIEVLRLDSDVQTTLDRETLAAFLKERLKQARNEEGSLEERMLALLDYRRWHRFDLLTSDRGEAGFRKLTAKAYGAGSGGQKAVLLHLPLFAAASAFFNSAGATAPRFVLLDEAFAGVDPAMRADLLGLLCKLDIDWVLTAFSEWGCYTSVDGTAIYQLTREKGIPGVLAERWVWDGTVRTAMGETVT